MPPRHRRKFDAGAQTGARSIPTTLSRAPPVLLLIATVPVAADDAATQLRPEPEPAAARATSGAPAQTGTHQIAAERLIVPLDPTAVNDSAFLRRLLLSHGIELDIGEHPIVDGSTLGAIRDAVQGDDDAGDGITLGDGDALEATLLIDVAELLARYPASRFDGDARTGTHYFRLPDAVALAAFDDASGVAFDGVSDCDIDPDLLDLLRARDDGPIDEDLAAELWAGIERPAATSDNLRATHLAGVSRRWRTRWIDCGDLSRPVPTALGKSVQLDRPQPTGPVARDIPESAPRLPSPVLDPEPRPPQVGPLPESPPNDLPGESASGVFMISDEAPPGFEGLAGPRAHVVDLRFNERNLGAVFVTVTGATFTFDDPAAIVALLVDVKTPAELLEVLSTPLATNAAKRCYAFGDPPGCGVVEGDPVAAILDEDQLQLDLFIAPELQRSASLDTARYLDEPTREGSSILSLGAVASSLSGQGEQVDLYARGLIGYGRGSLAASVDSNSRNSRTRLRELRYTHHFREHELSVGSFPFSPGAGLGDVNLLGVALATSYETRLDLENALGTDLVVYLPRRAIVQLVVDGRVLSGDSYPPGNATLDTSMLSDGSYEVEIRVIDAGGETRVERRVFTKSTAIPPRGDTVFALNAGVPLYFDEDRRLDELQPAGTASTGFLPDSGERPVLGLSVSRRFTDRSAWRIGLVQLGADSNLQSELIYLGQHISSQFAMSVGENDLLATTTRVSLDLGPVGISLSMLTSRVAPIANTDDLGQRVYLGNFDEATASLSTHIGRTQLGLRASRRRDEGVVDEQDTVAMYARRSLFGRRSLRGSMDFSLERSNDATRVGVGVDLSLQRGRSSGTLFGGIERTGSADPEVHSGLELRHQGPADALVDWNVAARADRRGQRDSVGLRAEAEHPWFGALAASDWTRHGGSDDSSGYARNSVASLHAQIGVDGDGAAIGGASYAESGVIVAIGGEPAGEPFDIVVNDLTVATGRIGTSQFVSLPPFQAYRLALVTRGMLSNGLGSGLREFTLYPGGVERIDMVARREILLVGSLVDDSGALIVDALLELDDNPALVDSSGVFQAEVSPGQRIEVRLANDSVCSFIVPAPAGDEQILVAERPLQCSPSTTGAEVQ